MSFGKLYTKPGNTRSRAILAVAKENKLNLEIVPTIPAEGVSKEYLELNPLGKVPSFQAKDGFFLTEAIAIAIYITSQNEKTSLLGKTKQDYASILRWMSFANSEVQPPIGNYLGPLIAHEFYNKKNVDDAHKAALKAIAVLEKHLLVHTFLVGERVTLADYFTAGIVGKAFEHFLDKKWRAENPSITRWYETIVNQPSYASVNEVILVDEAIKNQPPKKEHPKKDHPKKETQKTVPKVAAVAKPKAAEEDDEEEEAKPAPKAKHPLEALERPEMVLDDWKRKYSNTDTRSEALPWFWEHYNPKDYSLWRLDYKYNEDLTLTFMSSNLVGGFFTRLEASRKYIFGAASVYGKPKESVIVGAFLIRGQNAVHAFDVAPDYESYEFTKLDASKAADKEFVADQWAWDKGVTVNGKEYEWADGKVFK